MASTFRILQGLVKAEMVQRRVWKNSKVYSCLHNEKVDFARELFHEEFDGLGEFVQAVQDLSSIQNILLHGVQKKGGALPPFCGGAPQKGWASPPSSGAT